MVPQRWKNGLFLVRTLRSVPVGTVTYTFLCSRTQVFPQLFSRYCSFWKIFFGTGFLLIFIYIRNCRNHRNPEGSLCQPRRHLRIIKNLQPGSYCRALGIGDQSRNQQHLCSLFSTQETIVGVIPASHHLVMIEQIAGFCKNIGRRNFT